MRSRPTTIGWIDGDLRGHIRGWAMKADEPSLRLSVEVVDESGSPITRVLADRYRADVEKAGFGDGHYGFAVPLSRLRDTCNPRFLCGQPRIELKFPPSLRHMPAARTFNCAGLLLHLDGGPPTSCIAGWMLDRHHRTERRQLRVRSGSHVLATQRATLFRPDSLGEGGDGLHGFCLPLPSNPESLFIDDVLTGIEFRIS